MPDPLKPHWFQILLALGSGPLHGSAIVAEVLERTDGAMTLWPATLYGSLRDLEERGWIRESDPADPPPQEGGTRNFHELTPGGRAVLAEELHRLQGILDIARRRALLDDPSAAG